MTLDRWRGTPGLLGWLTLKWDVWMLKRLVRRMTRVEHERHRARFMRAMSRGRS